MALPSLLTKSDTGVPTYLIGMWKGSVSTIPDGWHLCDGTMGTPDLRGSFIIGAGDEYDFGDIGGNDFVTPIANAINSFSNVTQKKIRRVFL